MARFGDWFHDFSISVDPMKFLNGELTARDVVPLITGEPSPLTVEHADDGRVPLRPRLWGRHADDYDWIEWACELIGFEKEDVAGVRVEFDVAADYIILGVLLGDEWMPEYVVPCVEISTGEAPEPRLK